MVFAQLASHSRTCHTLPQAMDVDPIVASLNLLDAHLWVRVCNHLPVTKGITTILALNRRIRHMVTTSRAITRAVVSLSKPKKKKAMKVAMEWIRYRLPYVSTLVFLLNDPRTYSYIRLCRCLIPPSVRNMSIHVAWDHESLLSPSKTLRLRIGCNCDLDCLFVRDNIREARLCMVNNAAADPPVEPSSLDALHQHRIHVRHNLFGDIVEQPGSGSSGSTWALGMTQTIFDRQHLNNIICHEQREYKPSWYEYDEDKVPNPIRVGVKLVRRSLLPDRLDSASCPPNPHRLTLHHSSKFGARRGTRIDLWRQKVEEKTPQFVDVMSHLRHLHLDFSYNPGCCNPFTGSKLPKALEELNECLQPNSLLSACLSLTVLAISLRPHSLVYHKRLFGMMNMGAYQSIHDGEYVMPVPNGKPQMMERGPTPCEGTLAHVVHHAFLVSQLTFPYTLVSLVLVDFPARIVLPERHRSGRKRSAPPLLHLAMERFNANIGRQLCRIVLLDDEWVRHNVNCEWTKLGALLEEDAIFDMELFDTTSLERHEQTGVIHLHRLNALLMRLIPASLAYSRCKKESVKASTTPVSPQQPSVPFSSLLRHRLMLRAELHTYSHLALTGFNWDRQCVLPSFVQDYRVAEMSCVPMWAIAMEMFAYEHVKGRFPLADLISPMAHLRDVSPEHHRRLGTMAFLYARMDDDERLGQDPRAIAIREAMEKMQFEDFARILLQGTTRVRLHETYEYVRCRKDSQLHPGLDSLWKDANGK